MNSHSLLERLKLLEEVVQYRQPPPDGQLPYRYERGQLPVLISAPHGAAHMRNGRMKAEDEYTTGLARLLAAETGAHVLYATHLNQHDPNWDEETPYKRCLHKIVEKHPLRFVLDLHGMRNKYNIGLAIGTMNGRSCPAQEPLIEQLLTEQGFIAITQEEAAAARKLHWHTMVFNYSRFTGGLISHTITRFACQTLNIPAAQIEICSTGRIVERAPHDGWPHSYFGHPAAIEQSVQALIALIYALADF